MQRPGTAWLGGLALTLLLSTPAAAVVAQVWTETGLRFTNLGRAKASATATGVATLHTSSSTSVHLSTITLTGQSLVATTLVTDPTQAPITQIRFDLQQRPDLQGGGVIGNLSGAIGGGAEGPALTPRTIPATGAMTVCFLVHVGTCLAKLPVPMGATSAGAQVGPGVGGLLTVGGTGTMRLTVVGAPYTVRTVSAFARTENGGIEATSARGFAHGPVSLTSSTAQTSGVLQIVTAAHVTVAGPPNDQDLSGALSHTLVHIVAVPEPGLLLLLLSGAGLLGLLGSQRSGRG